jgi:hypothetical protein
METTLNCILNAGLTPKFRAVRGLEGVNKKPRLVIPGLLERPMIRSGTGGEGPG